MTFQIDYEATRRAGLLLVADAADVAVASARVDGAPQTGHRAESVAAAIAAVTDGARALATTVTEDGETLSTLTSTALLVDLSAAGGFLWA
ncbi:hypothetical protein [Nocardioides sambongensis]|uniref:hypothetical protein n=1 Tax=Nocardioides sambongensis TaxID=2589074 RepID=UPI00112975B5|nr:hypothetical protein [Nocardioides sambongensis]